MKIKNSSYVPEMSLDEAVRITIAEGELPVKTLATEIGYPVHILKKAIDDETESGLNLRKLLQIMILQNDLTILECISQECGFMLVQIPRERNSGKTEMPEICDYFEIVAKTQVELSRYIKGKYSKDDLEDLLFQVFRMTARSMKATKA